MEEARAKVDVDHGVDVSFWKSGTQFSLRHTVVRHNEADYLTCKIYALLVTVAPDAPNHEGQLRKRHYDCGRYGKNHVLSIAVG